jgi:molybdenum cofactor cytidylyltransferase
MPCWSVPARSSLWHRLPMPELACAAILLAAGASTRLGQAKQLIVMDNESLLVRTTRIAIEAGCAPVIVVTGFEHEKMQAALAGLPVQLVHNPDWSEGMGSSLRCGVRALDPGTQAVLLLVCDQLALSTEFLRELLRVHRAQERPITASHYDGRLGVPAIFSAAFFPELCAVKGDKGARGVLESHTNEVTAIEFAIGTIDLDTPEQLQDFRRTQADAAEKTK